MDSLLSFYDDALNEYGLNDPRALRWRGDDSQLLRFKVLAEVGKLEGARILDEGCGLGDLYGFLQSRGVPVQYHGIDINPRLIEGARQKYPGVSFEVADFSSYEGKPVDFAFASGTFTYNFPNAKRVYFAQIAKMFQLARKAIAFNMLDSRTFAGDEMYITYSIPEVYDFCRQLTSKLIIRQDYSPEDFTFYLYR